MLSRLVSEWLEFGRDDATRQLSPLSTNQIVVKGPIAIATKVSSGQKARFEQIPGETWVPKKSARIDPLARLDDVLNNITVVEGIPCPVSDWGSPLWTGDKQAFKESRHLRGRSEYLKNAHRGTISDLARVYWVKVEKYSAETNRALIRTLRKDEFPKAQEVDPVEGAWIEADLLFPLIRGRNLGRYSLQTEQWHQIIPNAHYENVATEEEFAEKYPCAYSYFSNYRDLLEKRST